MTGRKIILTLVLLVLPAAVAIYFYSKSTEVRDTTKPLQPPGVPAPQLVKLMEEGEGKAATAIKEGTRGTPALPNVHEQRRAALPPPQKLGRQTPEIPGSEGMKRPVLASLPRGVDDKASTPASAPVTPAKEEKAATTVKEEARRTAALPHANGQTRAAPATLVQGSERRTPEHSGVVFVRRPIMASLPQVVGSKTQTPGTAAVTPTKEEKSAAAVKEETRQTAAALDADEQARAAPPTPAQRSGGQAPEHSGAVYVRRPIMASLFQTADSRTQTQASAAVTPAKEEKPAAAVKEETRQTAALPDADGQARAVQPASAQRSESPAAQDAGSQGVRQPFLASLPQGVDSKTPTPASPPTRPAKEKQPSGRSMEIRDSQDNRTWIGRGEGQLQGPSKDPLRPDAQARRVYQVRAGDCLATIATSSEVYGNFSMWKALYLANPEVIDYVYYRKTLPYVILEADLELQVPELSEARRLMGVIPSSRPLIIKLAEGPNLTEMLRLAVALKRVGHQIYIQELPSNAGTQYVVKLGFFTSKKEARNVLQSLPVEIRRDQCAVLRASDKEIIEHLPFSRRVTD